MSYSARGPSTIDRDLPLGLRVRRRGGPLKNPSAARPRKGWAGGRGWKRNPKWPQGQRGTGHPQARGRDEGWRLATPLAPRRPTSLAEPRRAGLSGLLRAAADWSRAVPCRLPYSRRTQPARRRLHQPGRSSTRAHLFPGGLLGDRPASAPPRPLAWPSGRKRPFPCNTGIPGGPFKGLIHTQVYTYL